VAQVVGCLPSQLKALSSNSSATTKKEKKPQKTTGLKVGLKTFFKKLHHA
jgi:hypothetical protein